MVALEWLAVNDHLPPQFWDPLVAQGRGTRSPRPATAAAPWGLRCAAERRAASQRLPKTVSRAQSSTSPQIAFHKPQGCLPNPILHTPCPLAPEAMAPSSMVGEVSRSPRCTKGWKYLRYDSLSVMPCGRQGGQGGRRMSQDAAGRSRQGTINGWVRANVHGHAPLASALPRCSGCKHGWPPAHLVRLGPCRQEHQVAALLVRLHAGGWCCHLHSAASLCSRSRAPRCCRPVGAGDQRAQAGGQRVCQLSGARV